MPQKMGENQRAEKDRDREFIKPKQELKEGKHWNDWGI